MKLIQNKYNTADHEKWVPYFIFFLQDRSLSKTDSFRDSIELKYIWIET